MNAVRADRLTVPEVATALDMTQSGVRKAIARGSMRARVVTPGKYTEWEHVVDRDEVERYRRDHRTPRLAQRPWPPGTPTLEEVLG